MPRESKHRKRNRTADRYFYTVQDDRDRARLLAGGNPWPEGMPRACIGPGFYCWPTRRQAESYRARLVRNGAKSVHILKYAVAVEILNSLRSVDLTTCSAEELDAWTEVHSEYTQNDFVVPHHYDFVIRETNHAGNECYFSPAAFAHFRPIG